MGTIFCHRGDQRLGHRGFKRTFFHFSLSGEKANVNALVPSHGLESPPVPWFD